MIPPAKGAEHYGVVSEQCKGEIGRRSIIEEEMERAGVVWNYIGSVHTLQGRFYGFIRRKQQNARFAPVNQRLPCTLGSILPAGTPVFKRGMNESSDVSEDAHFVPVNSKFTCTFRNLRFPTGDTHISSVENLWVFEDADASQMRRNDSGQMWVVHMSVLFGRNFPAYSRGNAICH